MSSQASLQIMSPVPKSAVAPGRLAPPLRSLQGCTLGLRVEWANFGIFIDRIEERLQSRFDLTTKRWDLVMEKRAHGRADTEPRRAEFEQFAAGIDAAIVGLAACGSCTAWSVEDALELHARGIPTVVVATDEFVTLVQSLTEFHDYPPLPVVVVPHPFHMFDEDEVLRISEERADDVIAQLLQPDAVAAAPAAAGAGGAR